MTSERQWKIGDCVQARERGKCEGYDHGVIVEIIDGGTLRVHWTIAREVYTEDPADLVPADPLVCGACARVGTNATDALAHALGCEHAPAPAPAASSRPRVPMTLATANAIEGHAKDLADAVDRIDRASQSSLGMTKTAQRMINRAAMDRDIALGKLATLVLAALQYANDRAQPAAADNEPHAIHTACRHCGLDIEGWSNSDEWRDRGNNTACPLPRFTLHTPPKGSTP